MLTDRDDITGENTPAPAPGRLMLGIDTGGTYTDAVLFSEESGIVAKAKALTTRHDLSLALQVQLAA